MPVKINKKDNLITLTTKNTKYVMTILHGRFPVHLYYGKKSPKADISHKVRGRSFGIERGNLLPMYYPGLELSEFPFYGHGDFRPTALRLCDLGSGSNVTDFVYESARRFRGRVPLESLPFADADEATETLQIVMKDSFTGARLNLYYTVFPECDVISRHFVLENCGKGDLRIEKCMSLSLDIPAEQMDSPELISFYGGHCRERNFERTPIPHGTVRIESRRGATSHQANPFFMLAQKSTTEERGDCYGFNLVYSGSFLDEIDRDELGTVRASLGLGGESFSMLLEPGQSFTCPEAVMTYSARGIGQVSRNMHDFVRSHILPPEPWEKRTVVLNSWEAFIFDINETIMVDFAAAAAECGADTVVMDDGWFGARTNDRAGLGDWYPNPDRFKDGLIPFIKRVKAKGVRFGIWIEPEMANVDSDLYRAHPEWCLSAPGRELTFGRNQLVLDMANPEVIAYLKDSLSRTFDGADIDYLKWDMNRHMCSVYSNALPPERQSEAPFRYMLGVYELYRFLRERYPQMMIENCSGGGGRYDLGMMKYSTQIWTSDQTDPIARTYIQHGSSYGYPATVMSCHVTNHDDSAEDPRKLEYGFRVALGGPLGYEFNALKVSDRVRSEIRRQIAEYRIYEDIILHGDLYRLLSPQDRGIYAFYYITKDCSQILLSFLQNKGDPKQKEYKLKISRAVRGATYRDTISGELYSGDELARGLTIKADTEGEYAKMFHFVIEKQS